MQSYKSPFVVIDEFISPLHCEDIINRLNHGVPELDDAGQPLLTINLNRLSDIRILPLLEDEGGLIDHLEQYYGYTHKGILPFNYEWYVAGHKNVAPRCENSNYTTKGWVRTNDYDFTGIIFLNDYQDKPPFDPNFEVVGGKLEFPNHDFAFNPQRGRLIIFPGNQNFVNHTSPVIYGELNQIRFQIVGEERYEYDQKNFNGTFKEWFS